MSSSKSNSIVIVLVLYNTILDNCISYKTLCNSIKGCSVNWNLILYNNSSEIKIQSKIATKIINATKNEKLSKAYNYALNYAIENDIEWLLLLDQDTEIEKDYFVKLSGYFDLCNEEDNIVAVIPFLKDNSRVISPHKNSFFNCFRLAISEPGVQTGFITALNSLSLLKVNFINSIGGFSEEFPLDMLDYWYFFKIFKYKKNVFLLDTYINHSLSLTDMERNMSIERYSILLKSEGKYINEFNKITQFLYRVRLIFRTIKQFIGYKNKKFSLITFKHIIK